jgi:hypothetical protein
MNSTNRNSIIWAVVLLIEAIILKFSKRMRLWIYIALPILAGFAAVEYFNRHPLPELIKPKRAVKKRNLK